VLQYATTLSKTCNVLAAIACVSSTVFTSQKVCVCHVTHCYTTYCNSQRNYSYTVSTTATTATATATEAAAEAAAAADCAHTHTFSQHTAYHHIITRSATTSTLCVNSLWCVSACVCAFLGHIVSAPGELDLNLNATVRLCASQHSSVGHALTDNSVA
jgi:hypothetical protein